jgi:hypothetical protein
MAQSVTLTLRDDGSIKVNHGPGSEGFAGYLVKVLDQLNNPKGAQKALMAKARLGDTVLEVRRLQKEKADALIAQSAIWAERAIDPSLNWDIRQLNKSRAEAAKAEAAKIFEELGE